MSAPRFPVWSVAIQVLFVLLNLACIVFLDGGWWNWAAAGICLAGGVYAVYGWRRMVADHEAHVRFMAAFDRLGDTR